MTSGIAGSLENKSVIVTGGASGIGAATALLAVGAGASVAHCVEDLGVPYGQVAAAGDTGGLIHEMDESDWAFVLGVNATGAFLTAKHVASAMLEKGAGGSIVLVSSAAAFVSFGAGKMGAYAASKGALSALVRAMAVDYGSLRIRVNALAPRGDGDTADVVERPNRLGRGGEERGKQGSAPWTPGDSGGTGAGGRLAADRRLLLRDRRTSRL